MRLLVDSPAFMAQLERDVAAATRSIHAQVMSFEGDEAGTHFASLLTGRRDSRADAHHRPVLALPHQRPVPPEPEEHPEGQPVAGAARDPARGRGARRRRRAGALDEPCRLLLPRVRLAQPQEVGRHRRSHRLPRRHQRVRSQFRLARRHAAHGGRAGRAFMREDIRATLRGENLSSRRDFGDFELRCSMASGTRS